MLKEAIQKLIDENHARAEEYLRLNLEASERGMKVDEQVFIRNYGFLLGKSSGLKDALEIMEKLENNSSEIEK